MLLGQTQVQELEMAKEMRENDVLRSLKASKKAGFEEVVVKTTDHCNPLISKNCASKEATEIPVSRSSRSLSGLFSNEELCQKKIDVDSVNFSLNPKPTREANGMVEFVKGRIDLKEVIFFPSSAGCSDSGAKHKNTKYGIQESAPSISAVGSANRAVSVTEDEGDNLVFLSESRTCYSNNTVVPPASENVAKPMFNIRTEASSSISLSEPGMCAITESLLSN